MSRVLLVLFLGMLWSTGALAAQLRLVVPVRELKVGETVSAELQLTNGQAARDPSISAGDGVRLQFQGSRQTVQTINFQTTTMVTYGLTVTALEPGTWSVGPAYVEVDGQKLTASPVEITVRPRSAEEQAQTTVTGTLSDDAPYVGEAEVYRFQYRSRDRVYDARWTPPEYDGLKEAPDAEATQREYTLAEDGQPVTVQEIFIPLVASEPGAHVISPALVTAQIPDRGGMSAPRSGSLFGRSAPSRTETFSTAPVPVTVRPLPREGQPPGFSGLVGVFSLVARPSAREVVLGESLTLEIRLSGDGVLGGFKLPLPPQDGFRLYDDAADYQARVVDGRYQSTATFRRAVVPEAEGSLVLPPVEVTVFDPDAERYVTLRTEPVSIEVLPGTAGAGGEVTSFSGAPRQRPVEALGEDIVPARGDATIRDRSVAGLLPLLVGAPAVPALGLAGALLLRVRERRRMPTGPWAELDAGLRHLPAGPAERLAALEYLLRAAVAARVGEEVGRVDRALVLAQGGEDAAALYAALSRARYGGAAEADEVAALEARLRALVAEVRP